MNWIYFTIGFASCLLLVFLFLLWVYRNSMVEPSAVTEAAELQNLVGDLYRQGKNGGILHVLDRHSGFAIRIIKKKRKTKEDTLTVEIRAGDRNKQAYGVAKETLLSEGIEFEEQFTPKLNRPSRIFLKNDAGGVFTVSAMTQAVSKILTTIGKGDTLDVLASDHDPHFWKNVELGT